MPELAEEHRYRHRCSSEVVFGDLDSMGHMNNLALLRLLETGRVGYMVETGLAGHTELTYVLARLEADFRAQGQFGDRLTCGTRIATLGRTSFTMEQSVWREDHTVLLRGRSVLVALADDKQTPASVPQRWRQVITQWEPGEVEDSARVPPEAE